MMGKTTQNPTKPCEEGCYGDPSNICHLRNISDQNFREEMLQMFNSIKEMMEWTAQKMQEDMREEMRNFKQ